MSSLDKVFLKIFDPENLSEQVENRASHKESSDETAFFRTDSSRSSGPHFSMVSEDTTDSRLRIHSQCNQYNQIKSSDYIAVEMSPEEEPHVLSFSKYASREVLDTEKETIPFYAKESSFVSSNDSERTEKNDSGSNADLKDSNSSDSVSSDTASSEAVSSELNPSESLLESGLSQDIISFSEHVFEAKLPSLFTKLPREATREFYILGEFLYDMLLEGNKIFGFKGTKKEVGCSTLLLGVASELIKKGLSLLLIDGNCSRSDLLPMLGLNEGETYRFSNCRISCSDSLSKEEYSEKPRQSETPLEWGERLQSYLIKITVPPPSDWRNFFRFLRKGNEVSSGPSFYLLPFSHCVPSQGSKERSESEREDHFPTAEEIRALAQEFDIVLVDSGACNQQSSEEILSRMLQLGEDGYFIVQDVREPEECFIQELSIKSMEYHLPCLGIIENFV